MAVHGYVRATGDLDILVSSEESNAKRLFAALADFGAPLADMEWEDFMKPDLVFQIGLPPLRVDILTSLDGLSRLNWETDVFLSRFFGAPVPTLSRDALITNKEATGRVRDLSDAEELRKIKP